MWAGADAGTAATVRLSRIRHDSSVTVPRQPRGSSARLRIRTRASAARALTVASLPAFSMASRSAASSFFSSSALGSMTSFSATVEGGGGGGRRLLCVSG